MEHLTNTHKVDMKKILIADDEPEILEIMARKISLEGYSVVTACDGQEAWEKIESENPDVIMLDLTMPRMGGLEVLKKLRENPPGPKWQPVIIVSALNELKHIEAGLSLEADHYITKPCTMVDILKGIRLMLSLVPQRITKSDPNNDN